MKITKQYFKQPWFVIVIFLGVAVLGCSAYSFHRSHTTPQQTRTICTVSGVTTLADVAESEDQTVLLDLYTPQRHGDCPDLTPVVVWVHGGSFSAGDKAMGIEYKKQFFTQQGWAFASVGYRLTSPERPIPHPAQANDVAAAIGWLHQHRQRYGLNAAQTMLIGYSAGAYLASLVSTDSTYASTGKFPPGNIICTVALDTGAYDLPRYIQSDDGAVIVYKDILGADEDSLRQHSPLHRAALAKHLPDFLLVTRGDGIRPVITQSFADELVKKRARATVFDANPYMHGDLDTMLGVPGDSLLTPEVLRFFRDCTRR